jgi:DNA-binding MarR family transcriptional regulator/GNAT superfamily N-acetyltransferase
VPNDPGLAIEAIRRFNRFYTRRIGVLHEGLLASPFTLAQARVLFELATQTALTPGRLVEILELDPGYLSRILQGFIDRRLITRRKSPEDGRRAQLSLTLRGRKAFNEMDRRSHKATGAMISPLSTWQRERILGAMRTLERTLSPAAAPCRPELAIRTHRIGDAGWAIEQHGRLYAQEFGWNGEFEALVATLFARFITQYDPQSERFWVAELDGERVGCVFVARNEQDPDTAQLRCLLVHPNGRGLGLGQRLIAECLAFAKSAGYRRMLLWTNDVLIAARRLYEAAGFILLEQSRHRSFGHELVGQTWAREL